MAKQPAAREIVVASVPDEYARMEKARHACGGRWEIGARTSVKRKAGIYLDRFALTCRACGAHGAMTFRVDSTTPAYQKRAVAATRRTHGKGAADMLAWAGDTSGELATLLIALMQGELETLRAGNGTRKPAKKAARKSAKKSAKKPAQKTAAKPAKKPAAKPTKKPAKKPAAKPATRRR